MSELFEKVSFGNLTVKNRMVFAPMGFGKDPDGGISDSMRTYLVDKARGGFGLVYPSACIISSRFEPAGTGGGTYLTTGAHASKLSKLAEQVHQYGAKLAVQFSPGLGRVHSSEPSEITFVSASECQAYFRPDVTCKALTKDDIKGIIEDTARAAAFAKSAGVDLIELHAYGGYLLDQFISKQWNHRSDEYGGSIENRLRFALEMRDAIRSVCGNDFPISFKYTPSHSFPGGRTLEDEGIEIAKYLDKEGFAFIHLDHGSYERWNLAVTTAYEEMGCQLFLAERLKKEGIKTPFLVQGKINDPKLAKKVVKDGIAELIALGHQGIADPDWPNKVKRGEDEDIRYCIGCNECLGRQFRFKFATCAVNPLCSMENDYALKPAKEKRKLLVIGGGAAGMTTAITAAKQGHQVEIWEKEEELGGRMLAAGAPSFKHDMLRYNGYLKNQLKKLNVPVCLGKEADVDSIVAWNPDAVVVAAGAKPIIPNIPGVNNDNVIEACDLLTNKVTAGNKVVVLGGGLVGCEVALHLDQMGKKVTVVEKLDKLLMTVEEAHNNLLALGTLLKESNIESLTGTELKEIVPGGVKVVGKDGEKLIECDTVVIAVGFRAEHTLADALEDKIDKVFTIGDYNKPAKVLEAVHSGYHTIRLLDDLMVM